MRTDLLQLSYTALTACGAVALANFLSIDLSPFLRMIVICASLFLAMKGLVYLSWCRQSGERLNLARALAYFFLWFGMNPRPWLADRKPLRWQAGAANSLLCFASGILFLLILRRWEIINVIPLFLSVSLCFHFGIIGLTTAFWRAVGIPVRPLFRNIFKSRNLADFWGKRWNVPYAVMMSHLIDRPLKLKMNKFARILSVFLISGLFHEAAITLPVYQGYGAPTLFFLIQGMLIIIFEVLKTPPVTNRIVGAFSLLLTLPLLFPKTFVEDVIVPPLNVFVL